METPMKFMAALAGAALVVAAGSAYTAASTPTDSVAGYGTSTVSGATAVSVNHTLNATGDKITATTVVFTTPQTNNDVKAGFDGESLVAGVVGEEDDADTVTFTWAGGKTTADVESFEVAVTNK